VTIDTTGQWWKGSDFADLAEYVRRLTADGYPAREILQSMCACGGTEFRLEAEPDEGCARRTCAACGASAFIGDSADYWEEVEPEPITCQCGSDRSEIGVGFSYYQESDDVHWITVGVRCVDCGVLGSPAGWKVDYSPTDHLLRQV
jgi:hypothetical protein